MYAAIAGTCANPALTFAALGAGPQVWNFVPYAVPTAPFVNGIYTISAAGRSACSSQLSAPACGAGNDILMGTAGKCSTLNPK